MWFCETNSGHAHHTAWEAENCTMMGRLLHEVQGVLADHASGPDDAFACWMALDEMIATMEAR